MNSSYEKKAPPYMEQLQKEHCNNFFGIWTQVLMLLCRIGPKFYSHHGFLVFPLSPLPHKDSLLPLQSRFVGSSTLHLVGPRSKYRGLPSIIFRLGLKIPFPPAKPHLQEEANSSGNSYKTRTDTVFIISKSGGWEMNVIHSKV